MKTWQIGRAMSIGCMTAMLVLGGGKDRVKCTQIVESTSSCRSGKPLTSSLRRREISG